MLKNYLKIAYRNIFRRKTFSLINILGLAFGIAACLIIYTYVSFERSYDTFNVNADNIYRLKNVRYFASGTDSSAGCVGLLGPTLKEDIPEVVAFSRLRKDSKMVSVNNDYFKEKNIFWADSSFLTMFSYPLIEGNPENALLEKYTAVITKEIAKKYFGKINVTGKTIQIGRNDFKITGVAENVPLNSHIKFDILLSFNTLINERFVWGFNNNNTYIQVKPGTRKSELEAKFPLIVNKLHNRKELGFDRAYFLQPLTDIHLHSNLRLEFEEGGSADTVHFLSLIAIVILLIAWINYINLSTARSVERAKEVGLRKVSGAGYWALVRQFLLESFIINLIAVLISIFIVEITFPYLNEIVGIPVPLWKNMDIIMLLLFLIFINPVVAGMYPAFVISSYSPVSILRGSFKRSSKGIFLRQGLVIFQFSVTIILIAAIIVFERQISFMMNNSLGFNIKQKLVVNAPTQIPQGGDKSSLYNTFLNEMKNKSLVEDATFSSVIPGMENMEVTGGIRQSKQSFEDAKQIYFVYAAQNYLDFFNIELICGRNFFESELRNSYGFNANANGLILNESAAKELGFKTPENALEAPIYNRETYLGKVIGVIKDYHQESLDKPIKPLILEGITKGNFFIFNINTQDLSKKIEDIKAGFTKMFPGNTFEYNFLDEFFDRQYRANIQTTEILGIFTFLSIFISCLGLVGLSSLMIIHRTKEIGVRKVLGASVPGVVFLLTKEFIKWVFIANVIAWPVAFYFMSKWLQNFAYRIEISWWIFALSGGIALVIALATVSLQAIKAAMANPVESLKYE